MYTRLTIRLAGWLCCLEDFYGNGEIPTLMDEACEYVYVYPLGSLLHNEIGPALDAWSGRAKGPEKIESSIPFEVLAPSCVTFAKHSSISFPKVRSKSRTWEWGGMPRT